MPKAPRIIKLGPIEATTGIETPSRIALLLWGAATCGKTTFAATAPGVKLWISFGDNEHVPISNRDDVIVADVSSLGYADLFKHAQNDNPFGLDTILAENEDIGTVVVDSCTAIEYRALQKAVKDGVGKGRDFTPTMEAPGKSAYGGRNAILLEVITGILRVTAKHNVHVIITAHEADAVMVKGSDDTIDFISVMLGGKLVNNVTWRLSEIWFMSQESTGDRNRKLAIRPTRHRRPMKTRMFDQKGAPEFVLDYDPDKPDKGQMTIESFYDQWMDGEKKRIPVPESKPKVLAPAKKR